MSTVCKVQKIWYEWADTINPAGLFTTVRHWYWMDSECEEPMGPFDTYLSCLVDWYECRMYGR